MSTLSRTTLLGRLGGDPQLKTFDNGGQIATFSVATDDGYMDRTTNQWKELPADWHNVVVNGKNAKFLADNAKKGGLIYVEGKMKTRSYTDKDGATKYVTELRAERVILMHKPGEAPGGCQNRSSYFPALPTAEGPDDDLPF